MRSRARWRAVGAVASVVGSAILIGPEPATAQTGPSITLDRSEVAPGEPLVVTLTGFESPFVNVVVCGNLAYRGATDCSMTAGVSKETLPGGRPKLVQLIAHPPPAHCPCIVRATASSGDAFAVAPLVIAGHPVGDLVGVSDGPLVEVEVDVSEANRGLWASLKSALGGRTRYEATVSVRSNTTAPLTRLVLSGSVAHWSDDDAAELDLGPPAALEPGQTWTQEVVAEVTAPSFGGYEFEVIASGAGSAVIGTGRLFHHPVLLYLLTVVLAADLVVMVWRWIARRAGEPQDGETDDVEQFGDHDGDDDHIDVIDLTDLTPAPSEPASV